MSRVEWGDHHEQRLELRYDSGCRGEPLRHGDTDQRPFAEAGCVVFGDDDFHLPVGKLAEFVATLYEAAGLPVPIVLDRVDGDKFSHWFELGRSALGPSVLLDPHASLSFKAAREFAAALVAAVERAESEPDPAEVEALAEVLHAARERCGGAGELDRQSARTILARYTLTERKPGGGDD